MKKLLRKLFMKNLVALNGPIRAKWVWKWTVVEDGWMDVNEPLNWGSYYHDHDEGK